MASRRPSNRENHQGPPVTHVSDPEEILRRSRASLRQTSRATRGATSGISVVISNRPPFQYSSAETYNSQEFIIESENFRVEESSSTAACVDPIPSDFIEINSPRILSQLPPTPVVSPSTLSMPTSNMAAPLTKMERILIARYYPLNFPNPLSAIPTGDYLKYRPKFTGEGDFMTEEHLEEFYSYAENIKIEQECYGEKFLWLGVPQQIA